MFGLPAFPYPTSEPEDGYWQPQTSTINWCEEDYYATRYIGEIVNTLTNLLFMGLGIRGIRNCIQNGHDTIFLISYVGYTLVGAGSFAFHASLKYPMQLVDELAMIYTTSLMAFAIFSFSRSRLFKITLGLCLISLSVFITLYYHYLQDPDFHQNAFALMAVIVVFRSIYVMEISLRPSLQKGRKLENGKVVQTWETQRDKQILYDMWAMVILGLTVFLGGFGIWSLDNHYCTTIRRWRHDLGLPWGLLLEGHGWWHLMTGAGAYMYIVWGIWLRHCLNGRQDEYVLIWPNKFLGLPSIVKAGGTAKPTSNGRSLKDSTNGQNGHSSNGGLKKIS